MQRFERSDESTDDSPASEQLEAFTRAIAEALVRDRGECELEQLLATEDEVESPAWEWLYNRAQRCIANWCIANPGLIDRQGRPIEERGIRDLGKLLG